MRITIPLITSFKQFPFQAIRFVVIVGLRIRVSPLYCPQIYQERTTTTSFSPHCFCVGSCDIIATDSMWSNRAHLSSMSWIFQKRRFRFTWCFWVIYRLMWVCQGFTGRILYCYFNLTINNGSIFPPSEQDRGIRGTLGKLQSKKCQQICPSNSSKNYCEI